MRRYLFLVSALVILFVVASPAFPEAGSEQIILYRLKEGGEKEIRDTFSPGERIHADFTFLPEGRETSVEFRWLNPLNKKEQVYSELVRSPIPPKKLTIVCWLYLPSLLSDKIIGSKYFGRWLLEVWVNNHRTAIRAFSVGN
jgi:hypothetical protein